MKGFVALVAIVAALAVQTLASENEGTYRKSASLEEMRTKYNVKVLSEDPLILEFENFIAENEIETLIRLGNPIMQRSTGGLQREISSYRTSQTGWLTPDNIKTDDDKNAIMELEDRIADVTGVSAKNQEHFQVLHYDVGQYYHMHHDYIQEQAALPCGPRIITFFLYLSDVEEGGGTYFPHANLVVTPKRGRAVMWYNADPQTLEQVKNTNHEAMSVIKGEKWAANKWIHSGNFVDNWAKGLTG